MKIAELRRRIEAMTEGPFVKSLFSDHIHGRLHAVICTMADHYRSDEDALGIITLLNHAMKLLNVLDAADQIRALRGTEFTYRTLHDRLDDLATALDALEIA